MCLFQIWFPWCVCPEVGLLGHMEVQPGQDLPDPGMEPGFPVSAALQADSLPLSHWGSLKDDGRIIKIFSCI